MCLQVLPDHVQVVGQKPCAGGDAGVVDQQRDVLRSYGRLCDRLLVQQVQVQRRDSRVRDVGELAEQAGVSTRALRYYEEQLLLSPQRTSGGHRFYPEAAIDRVKLIQQLYTAGLSSRLIAALLPAIDARSVGPDPVGIRSFR
ncbi:MerR family transcriptional regulator [Streptomyces pseudogriseolus]|uniref:MerR family transcriptional regulator n=1 Tax=Streptomyces pseudogriseolus TaxID=36817 RepID=UPI003FA1CDE8